MRQKIIDAADMVADISSDVFRVGKGELATVTADWSGASDSPVGTLLLRYSPDYIEGRASAATWYNVTSGELGTSPAASASSTCEAFRGLAGHYQLFYDMTSDGDGDELTAWVELSDVR